MFYFHHESRFQMKVAHQDNGQSPHHGVEYDGLNAAVLLGSRVWFGQSRVSAHEALFRRTEGVGELAVVNQHDHSSQNHHLEVQHGGAQPAGPCFHGDQESKRSRSVTSSVDDVQFASACRILRFESVLVAVGNRNLSVFPDLGDDDEPPFTKSFSAVFCDSVRQRWSFRSCEFAESSERAESVDSFCLTEQSPKSCCSLENSDQPAGDSQCSDWFYRSGQRKTMVCCSTETLQSSYSWRLRSNIPLALWWLVVVELIKKIPTSKHNI